MREAYEIACELKDECGDRMSRLIKIRQTLEKRLEQIQPAIDEYNWLIRTTHKLQRAKNNTEWLEAEREHFAEIVDNPGDDMTSPPHLFKAMVELCDSLLADTAPCNQ